MGDEEWEEEDPLGGFEYTAEQDEDEDEVVEPVVKAKVHVQELQQPVPQNIQRPLWYMEIAAADKSHVLQVRWFLLLLLR